MIKNFNQWACEQVNANDGNFDISYASTMKVLDLQPIRFSLSDQVKRELFGSDLNPAVVITDSYEIKHDLQEVNRLNSRLVDAMGKLREGILSELSPKKTEGPEGVPVAEDAVGTAEDGYVGLAES